MIQEVTPQEVKAKMDAHETMVLVDVRENDEWAQGRIEGARHIRKGVIDQELPAQIADRATSIVLYCAGGMRSAAAAGTLEKLGYTQVFSMRGGIREWAERSFPVTR